MERENAELRRERDLRKQTVAFCRPEADLPALLVSDFGNFEVRRRNRDRPNRARSGRLRSVITTTSRKPSKDQLLRTLRGRHSEPGVRGVDRHIVAATERVKWRVSDPPPPPGRRLAGSRGNPELLDELVAGAEETSPDPIIGSDRFAEVSKLLSVDGEPPALFGDHGVHALLAFRLHTDGFTHADLRR